MGPLLFQGDSRRYECGVDFEGSSVIHLRASLDYNAIS